MQAVARLFYAVPLLGWMARDAAEGRESAKVWLLINLALAWLLSFMTFGYAGLIVPALALVAAMFVVLLFITAGR